MQLFLGSCKEEDISCLVACPVVAKHPKSNKIIVHGGGVHFSKDFMEDARYGYVGGHNSELFTKIDKSNLLNKISQDHGEVIISSQSLYDQINIGDILYIYPIHSCMAADLLKDNIIVIP